MQQDWRRCYSSGFPCHLVCHNSTWVFRTEVGISRSGPDHVPDLVEVCFTSLRYLIRFDFCKSLLMWQSVCSVNKRKRLLVMDPISWGYSLRDPGSWVLWRLASSSRSHFLMSKLTFDRLRTQKLAPRKGSVKLAGKGAIVLDWASWLVQSLEG